MKLIGPEPKPANGAATIELDANIYNCRRLKLIFLFIADPLVTPLQVGSAASKHLHSMVALKCITIDKARDMVTINQS